MKIVGFSGAAGAGKTTAAGFLCDLGWLSGCFSWPLKAMMLDLNPFVGDGVRVSDLIDRHEWDEWRSAKDGPYGEEVRRLLQVFGTNIVRDCFGENTWVDMGMARAEEALAGGKIPGYVFESVRFPNEAYAIHRAGGVVIQIDRPGSTGLTGVNAMHQSALDISRFADARVVNDGEPVTFRAAVLETFRDLLEKEESDEQS